MGRLDRATCTVHLISAPDQPETNVPLSRYIREAKCSSNVLIYILWSQAKKPSKKKLRSYSMRKNLYKLTKRENSPAREVKNKTSPIEQDDEISQMEETLEIIQISESQIGIIKSTWNTLSRELGEGLSYLKNDSENNPVTEPFLRLFEEYPMSQQFFLEFRGTPTEALRNDVRLNTVLQEHGVRVMRVVEKVIGRLEDLEKVLCLLIKSVFWTQTKPYKVVHKGIPIELF